MASNVTPTDVTPSIIGSGITIDDMVLKAQTSSLVLVFEDFDATKLDDTIRCKGDIVVMQACMERNHKHLLQEVLPIYTQEDPYLISLLSWQKYIDIVNKAPTRWVDGVCILFHIVILVWNVATTR